MRIKWQEKLTEGPRNPCPPGSPLGPGGPCWTERRVFTSVLTLTPQSPGIPSSWAVPISPNPPEEFHPAPDLQLPKAYPAFNSTFPWNSLSICIPQAQGSSQGPPNKSCPRTGHSHSLQGCCALNLVQSHLPQGGDKDKNPTRTMICRTPRPSAWHRRRTWGLGWVCQHSGYSIKSEP